jgi:Phage integrase family
LQVLLHSGVFVKRQYCNFAGILHGQKSTDFIKILVERRFAMPITIERSTNSGWTSRGTHSARAVRTTDEAAAGPRATEGGADPTRMRASVSGGPRASESAEAERDRCERDDSSRASRARARSQARRDRDCRRVTPEEPPEHEGGQDGDQHPAGSQRVAEEGRGMGRDRSPVPLTRQMAQYRVLRASRRAKLPQEGVDILRYIFCSHLEMRVAPVRAIQEFPGHRDLGMTQRYMHLSPAALQSAIRLLDQAPAIKNFGRYSGDSA